jgi:tetratricopeptide (TPR) repeat protein
MRFRHAVRAPEDITQGPEMLNATQNAPNRASKTTHAHAAWRHTFLALAAICSLGSACAQSLASPQELTAAPLASEAMAGSSDKPAVNNSTLDANLFYQLLISEIQVRQGDLGTAYQLYLDAAKRTRDAQLFQRSVDYALQARAGEQALAAAKAWRQSLPESREASEYTAQILMALGRYDEVADPIRSVLRATPVHALPSVLIGLPRSMGRITDRKAVAKIIEDATVPWREGKSALVEAWVADSEGWLMAGDANKAYRALESAMKLSPSHPGIGLIASELMTSQPELEQVVLQQLKTTPSDIVRLAYARKLTAGQRLNDAAEQLDVVVKNQPDNAQALLTLGAVRLELGQAQQGEATLRQLLTLKPAPQADGSPGTLGVDLETVYSLLAQSAEQRKQYAQADEWLRKADPDTSRIKIQAARAKLLLIQGKVQEGFKLLRAMPESEPRDALAKLNAEVQLLREMKAYDEALKLLQQANSRFPNDPSLLYDQAMVAEQLGRHDEVDPLLRRVIQLNPEDPNAYNALGYSLADRNISLDEAQELVGKALSLKPGDPFITDSLGWVAYRQGRLDDARTLLQQAFMARPDPEIAAHLGEVLWVQGRKEEAIKVWREGKGRDATNKTLRDTLQRFQPKL